MLLEALDTFYSFISGLPKEDLDEGLIAETTKALKTNSHQNKIESHVMEALSKYVEVRLRKIVEAFLGLSLATGSRTGSDIIGAAVKSGLIETDETGGLNNVHFLLRWYFGERNPPHHDYPEYDVFTFLNYYLISNFLIREIEKRRIENPLKITMNLVIAPTEVQLGTFYQISATIPLPDGSYFMHGEVKARISRSSLSNLKHAIPYLEYV